MPAQSLQRTRPKSAPHVTVTSTPSDATIEDTSVHKETAVCPLPDDAVRLLRDALDAPLPEPDAPDAIKVKFVGKLHRAIECVGKVDLELACRNGQVLATIKQREKNAHGWEAWAESKLPFSIKTANRYIAVYEGREHQREIAPTDPLPVGLWEAYKRYGVVTEATEPTEPRTKGKHKGKGKSKGTRKALDRDVAPLGRVYDLLRDYRRVTIKHGKVFLQGDAARYRKIATSCLTYVAKIEAEVAELRKVLTQAAAALAKTPKGVKV
ncbi:MAG: hypothetical protein KA383_12340 [Phycisphaerae bacterium]|nr:hypothetical protein [Phycisphaerae bacterium]